MMGNRPVWAKVLAVLCLGSTLIFSGCEDKDKVEQSAGPLIQAFRSGCATSGRWTDAALAHNRALISVLETLKETDPCRAHRNTLTTIAALSSQLQTLLSDSSFSQYRRLEESLQELTVALDREAPGTTLHSALQTKIVETQVALAQARAAVDADRFNRLTRDLGSYIQGMVAQADSLAVCLRQSPAAAVQLATNFAALGGSFVGPVVGAGVGILGQLINLGVEAARASRAENTIWDLYSQQMPIALGCGIEAMSELFCQADDSLRLLDLQAQQYPVPGEGANPIWAGLDILGRRLSVLNNWLMNVRNGVLPNDALEAQRQNRVWNKLTTLDNIYRSVIGEFTETRRLWDAASGDAATQQSYVLRLVMGWSAYLAGADGSSGPFAEYTSDQFLYACYFTIGLQRDCPTHDNQTNFEQFTRNLVRGITISDLFINWDLMFQRVKARVDVEFSQTINADPAAVLSAAGQPETDNVSPLEVLSMLRRFVAEVSTRDPQTRADTTKLLASTIDILDRMIALVSGSQEVTAIGASSSVVRNELDRVRDLFDLIQLRRGLQFLNERIVRIIQWDINARLANGDFPPDTAEIIMAASGDIRSRVLALGATNAYLLKLDLEKGQSITQGNIEVFREFFKESFGRSVRLLYDRAQRTHEPRTGPHRPNGQTLAHLCTMVLVAFPEWPREIPWSMCRDAVLSSPYPDPTGELTLRVSSLRQELAESTYQQRLCAFHRHMRTQRLAEVLRTRHTGRTTFPARTAP